MASYNGYSITKYGRQTIYIDLNEDELLSMSEEEQKEKLIEYLPSILAIHNNNKVATRYLWDYYLGLQDVLYKEKHTRKEINNKKVENWAYAIIDFKKAWQLGNAIQYVMTNSTSSRELSRLNDYCRYVNKGAKDQLIYEDILAVGRGYRFFEIAKYGESPFAISNIDRDICEVVYSSSISHEQLFSIIVTDMQDSQVVDGQIKIFPYVEVSIYLRNVKYVCKVSGNNIIEFDDNKKKTLVMNTHIIQEYYLNRDRISLIEIGKDLFDGINQLESLDFDDLEQFVNAIMVFTNAEVDQEGLTEIKELGAVNIKSTENRKAAVSLLQNRLNASDTQVMYARLLTALHQILGIPMATDNGTITSGDTGKARMTGQGYTSAGIRAKNDEIMFKMCDYEGLKVLLEICKFNKDSKIKSLKATQIDNQMDRDMTDNLLTKAQALTMLLTSAKIPKEYAVPIINLFSDSNAVVQAMDKNEKEAKKEAEKEEQKENTIQESQEAENLNTRVIESDLQGK